MCMMDLKLTRADYLWKPYWYISVDLSRWLRGDRPTRSFDIPFYNIGDRDPMEINPLDGEIIASKELDEKPFTIPPKGATGRASIVAIPPYHKPSDSPA
ncbi:hypothetical protein NL676_013552 [Syzygium grande]|nr:hypothetical protein NL676_013552 [Syzygium grande]